MYISFFRTVFKRCIRVCQFDVLPICSYQPTRFRSAKSTEGYKLKEELNKVDFFRYSQAKNAQFYQEQPKLDNPFLADIPLQSFLNHYVPEEVKKEISTDLQRFGDRIIDEIDDLGWECESNLPSLETLDVWGRRIDDLKTCHAWKKQHDISSEEGIVAIPYEQKLNFWSRLHQICKIYMYSPSAGLYTCPLAMTDGAAKTILSWKNSTRGERNERFTNAFNNLISRDPEKFWTSGQWMTERRGGSDVANSTETVAVPENDFYRLYGYKWFSSATDSNMALTLARVAQDTEVAE
ncbi:acyl-CoA dehydrogenase family member 11, partial [Nephila pilipes]